jgi:hypothetical protein
LGISSLKSYIQIDYLAAPKIESVSASTSYTYKMAESWIKNTLYSELVSNPIWLHAAFTRDSEFAIDQNGIRLINYLVRTTRAKCPSWDPDMVSSYIDVDAYMQLVKDAWTVTRDMWRESGIVAA